MFKINKHADILICITLIILMIVLTKIAVPMDFTYVFNFDESIELTRAHLLLRGYRFFEEVWNDHALGLPFVLSSLSKFFEIDLTTGRYVVLAFSCLAIAAFYYLMRLESRKLSSLISVIIIITSLSYISLSGLLVNEIPSLALGILSLLFMSLYVRHQSFKKYLFLLLCALSFMLSFEIKISAVSIIPVLTAIALLGNTLGSGFSFWNKKLKDALVWVVSSTSFLIILSLTVMPFSYYHLIGSHGNASDKLSATDPNLTIGNLILSAIQNDTIYFLIAVLSICSVLWSNQRLRFVPPLVWLFFNLLRFSLVSPVWSNYYPHLLFPSAWMICLFLDNLGLENFLQGLFKRNLKSLGMPIHQLILYTALILATSFQILLNTAEIVTASKPRRYQNPRLVQMNQESKRYKRSAVEDVLDRYKGTDKVILTDNPYFIHKFQLDTPPETAILSRKRVVTEGLDGAFILVVIQKRNPDFVLLERFSEDFLRNPALSEHLAKNYVEYELEDEDKRVFFVRNQEALLRATVNLR